MKISFLPAFTRIVVLLIVSQVLPVQAEEALTELVKKVQPSVVLILTYDSSGESLAQGSGFFVNKQGDIITNRHVLEKASRAEIKTTAGKVYPIKGVVAEDLEADLIQVTVDIPQKEVFPLAVSETVPEVGQKVVVIGNPLGLENTVSDGIVSAVREVPGYGDVIQITAPMSPGSSGSPVVNLKGELLGVATFQMIVGQNLNFVIPAKKTKMKKWEKEKTFEEWRGGIAGDWLESPEGLFYQGLNLVNAREWEKALPFFEKATQKKPHYMETYCLLLSIEGSNLMEVQKWEEALTFLQKVVERKPDSGAYLQIGVCKEELGRRTEAIEAYKQAIRVNPDNGWAHVNLGNAYRILERYADAIEAYKQAIRINPDDAWAYLFMGNAYFTLDRYTDAIEAYKQAIRIKPDDAAAHRSLGFAYEKLDRWADAVESYKQAIRIKPDDAAAHRSLGFAYEKLDRWTDAIECYKQAIRIRPDDASAHHFLGSAYYNLYRWTDAIECYKQAIRIKPDYAEAHYILGISYLLIGDKGSALDEYKILKDLNKELANELFDLIYK